MSLPAALGISAVVITVLFGFFSFVLWLADRGEDE